MESLLSQFIYFGFFQAWLLLLVLALSSKHRKNVNAYLLILIAVLLLGLCGRIFYLADLLGGSRRWVGLSEFSILLFGPTVYLFTLSQVEKKRFTRSDMVHYIPGVAYSCIVLFYYMLPATEVINERVISGELFRVVRILVGTGLIVNITYYSLSVSKYYSFQRRLKDELSFSVNLQFLRNFLGAIGACLLAWLIIYLWSFFTVENLEIQLRGFVWTAIAMIVLFIAYYQMIAPQVFKYGDLMSSGKYAQSKFSSADLEKLKVELERIMLEQKPFLNKKLLKAELAELLGVSNPELARLLNERIGMNFFEFVNYYRIQEFIQLSKQDNAKAYTFFGLAQEAGFNSKATFNKSFKNIMGCSPTHFLKK